MNNTAIICKLKNVRPHPNANKVQLADACNYQVVIGLEHKEGDLGVYFPTDTCLGKDFAEENPDLLTYFGKNLRVRTQSFRGEKSEGFWCHIQHLPIEVIEAGTKEGTEITTVNGKEICIKYINPETLKSLWNNRVNNISKKLRHGSLPTFQKHVDTEQLRYMWDKVPRDRQWIWTVKLHGTSQRVGNVLVERDLSLLERFAQWLGIPVATTHYEYLVGTRNVILGEIKEDGTPGKDGFYSDEFRKAASVPFLGKLKQGEVVYYEVVGYAAYNSPIMGKVYPKENAHKKLYGNKFVYSYGCANGQHDIYVYRIAYQNAAGVSIDLSWDQVKERCKEIGVKHVPEVNFKHTHSLAEVQQYIERRDIIDERHPMEGVVLRVEGTKPSFYKEKSFTFKVLEGIIKDSGQVDMEDAS